MKINQKIQYFLDQATKLALIEVEARAKIIMEQNPELTCFIMAMGTWCFWEGDEHLENESELVKGLDDFILEFNSQLYLTGYPIRIDRDNVSKELVTINDW